MDNRISMYTTLLMSTGLTFGTIATVFGISCNLTDTGLYSTLVVVGHEIKTIVELIKEQGFDLLVIGFMGRSALYDRVMGSTCQGLVRLAGCAVLVVR